ncbi:MAG: PEGA domain-containing protein [Planctomycetes bacterium]|nr:PEGA domain-containing protein [Planctomycetota bacterium]
MNKLCAIAALLTSLTLAGCIERTMTITSEPAGALVFVNDVEKGRTPVTFSYIWSGDYDVVLRLEGRKTLKTHARLNPQWYDLPPWDFFAELSPQKIQDKRYLHYKLEKLVLPGTDKLVENAEQLKAQNNQPPR